MNPPIHLYRPLCSRWLCGKNISADDEEYDRSFVFLRALRATPNNGSAGETRQHTLAGVVAKYLDLVIYISFEERALGKNPRTGTASNRRAR
jgi:hypothetical protein